MASALEGMSRLIAGEEISVDFATIEKSLSDIWRADEGQEAVTRAALWNVLAHTDSEKDRQHASDTLGRASASVPQRTILVQSTPSLDSSIAAWISANCHLEGGRQVCSEAISIIAGGERIHHVPSLVNALLIPDMPVAAWWLGDLPSEQEEYVTTLLDPVDRLIVDSVHFNSLDDMRLLARLASTTRTSPADLNWSRLEEWRLATASIFDPPAMRSRLRIIRSVRIVSAVSDEGLFGEAVESLYYAAWLSSQLGHQVDREGNVFGAQGKIDYRFERRRQSNEIGAVAFVSIEFDDGSSASIERNLEVGALKASVDGVQQSTETITRMRTRSVADLIVRQLSPTHDDSVFARSLQVASTLGRHIQR